MRPAAVRDHQPSGVMELVEAFQTAWSTTPAPSRGHRVVDVATALVVLCREDSGFPSPRLARPLQDLVRQCQQADGRVTDRCGTDGRPVAGTVHGAPGVRDSWGRALWGLGTAAARTRRPELAARAMEGFDLSCALRSPRPRAMAFAGLGAAEVLRVDAWHVGARSLLADSATAAAGNDAGYPAWPWPAARLGYANAVVPDVLLAAGETLGDHELVARGLDLLGWLLDLQTRTGHLCVVPVGGWSPGEAWPGLDQRPVEVATLADACARAFELTEDARWQGAVQGCASWFFGDNDAGTSLVDPHTGRCRSGLKVHEPGVDGPGVRGLGGGGLPRDGDDGGQGTEATLALISTLQHAARLRWA